jgi:dihydrofolate reductase
MREVVVLTFVSLDGVMQAPGGEGEDPSGGFDLEGWTVPYFDEVAGDEMSKQMSQPFDLLLGRKTYEIFALYWPHRDSPLNEATKYVVSNSAINTDWEETWVCPASTDCLPLSHSTSSHSSFLVLSGAEMP